MVPMLSLEDQRVFKLLLGGLSMYRTYLIIAAIAVSLGGAGWVGYHLAASHYKTDLIDGLVEDIAFYEDAMIRIQEINTALNVKEVEIRYVEVETIKEVEVYVETYPELANCKLDAAGLSLWNGEGKQE